MGMLILLIAVFCFCKFTLLGGTMLLSGVIWMVLGLIFGMGLEGVTATMYWSLTIPLYICVKIGDLVEGKV